ncbi:MAG: Mu-like prophage major head subunit gpT family protein [Arsenophonus sp. NC-CH8-MAG3]
MSNRKEYEGAIWYLLDYKYVLKLMIFQNCQDLNLLIMTNVDNDNLFTNKELLFIFLVQRNLGATVSEK